MEWGIFALFVLLDLDEENFFFAGYSREAIENFIFILRIIHGGGRLIAIVAD